VIARVLIKPKDGILDPQGKAVERALPTLGVGSVSDVRVGKGGSLTHYRLQLEGASFHLGAVRARIARDARFVSNNVVTGGVLTRNVITGSLDGENAHCTLNGLMLLRGTQHADNFTKLEHRMPHCESHELYKGVLDDRASGVFTGRIDLRTRLRRVFGDGIVHLLEPALSFTSVVPVAASRSTSPTTSSNLRLRSVPRVYGTMQKVHL